MPLYPIEQLAAQAARERDLQVASEQARKRAHGIVHTPPELARLVLRRADFLLRERLGLADGVCDPGLVLLDPACGPGAFFAAALALCEERGSSRVLRGVGFDVDDAALGLASRLSQHPAGAELVFEHADVLASESVGQRAEAHAGPLLLIGNPPWASARAQLSAADRARLAPFRCDAAGQLLAERKLGVLTDSYVRFFALCAELARERQAGAVVALVTNSSFLDGLVHRGMRARLASWFDEVEVLDLGGSALLGLSREQRDDNVFGVRPAVAVTWLCRYPRAARGAARPAVAHCSYARQLGSRAEKLAWLSTVAAAPEQLAFQPLAPEPPNLWFVPRQRRDERYASAPSLAEWLPFHREGVQSNRDAVVVAENPERLLERLHALRRGKPRPDLHAAQLAVHHFDPARARRAVAEVLERDPHGELGLSVQRVAYRPFDTRVFCPVTPLCHRPRPELTSAFAHAGNALVSVRKDRGDLPWTHSAWVVDTVDNCYLSARSSCRARAFPLCAPDGRDNLAPALAERLGSLLGQAVSARSFAHYALCIMSAASYRTRWDAELHQDYPRIPWPRSAAAWSELALLGEGLARLYGPLADGAGEAAAWNWKAPVLPAGSHYRDLVLDATQGCLRLHDEVLLDIEPCALALHVGHHRPLATYLRGRSKQPLDSRALQRVCALAQRLERLAAALREVDRVTARVLEHDASAAQR